MTETTIRKHVRKVPTKYVTGEHQVFATADESGVVRVRLRDTNYKIIVENFPQKPHNPIKGFLLNVGDILKGFGL